MIVLGIDTAIRCTGYGLIKAESSGKLKALDCGVIKNKKSYKHSKCLMRISGGIRELIKKYNPDAVSIEDAFVSKNIKTAMILSMARGAAISVCGDFEIPVYKYSPRTAKKRVTGTGGAAKEQIAVILSSLLNLDVKNIPLDSTDALALALSHIHLAAGKNSELLPESI